MRVRLNVRFMVMFRFAWKKRKHRVLLCVGLHEGSLTEFRTTQRLQLGALFDGRNLRLTCFLGSYLGLSLG